MGRRQTRKAISVKGLTYQRLKNWANELNQSVSGTLEQIITEKLDAENVPIPEKIEPSEPRQSPERIIGQHFTF